MTGRTPRTCRPSPTALVLILLTAGLLAGCVSPDDEESLRPGTTQAQADAETGPTNVTITILDRGKVPLQQALVRLAEENRRGEFVERNTNVLGIARFETVDPGDYRLNVTAAGHKPSETGFTLKAGRPLDHEIQMEAENRSYVDEHRFEGFFDCSATYLIITGDCLLAVRFLINEAGVPLPLNATNEQFVFPFPVHEGWSRIRIMQEWDDPDAALGTTMRVNLEPVDPNTEEGHSDIYARAQGESPITLEVEAGVLHPEASGEDLLVPLEGAEIRTRSFHLGLAETQDPAGTGFLGTGAAYQQRFTVHVEIHYED